MAVNLLQAAVGWGRHAHATRPSAPGGGYCSSARATETHSNVFQGQTLTWLERPVLPVGPAHPRPAHRRQCRPAAAGGFGSGNGSGSGGKEGSRQRQDKIREARTAQLSAADLLAKLLQAPASGATATAVAEEHLSSLDEQFFQLGSTFLMMAEKEGETDVYNNIKAALTAAMEVKQATLRPEIQLLNSLLAADERAAREQVGGLVACQTGGCLGEVQSVARQRPPRGCVGSCVRPESNSVAPAVFVPRAALGGQG